MESKWFEVISLVFKVIQRLDEAVGIVHPKLSTSSLSVATDHRCTTRRNLCVQKKLSSYLLWRIFGFLLSCSSDIFEYHHDILPLRPDRSKVHPENVFGLCNVQNMTISFCFLSSMRCKLGYWFNAGNMRGIKSPSVANVENFQGRRRLSLDVKEKEHPFRKAGNWKSLSSRAIVYCKIRRINR